MAAAQARNTGLPVMNLIRFKGMPILRQLLLEERLLRTSSDNWCIINDGTDAPTIVMGLSGKPAQLVEIGSVLQDRIPVIRRFTGGGTVIVDQGTVFTTLICNRDAIPGIQPYPGSIMQWSSLLYDDVFQSVGDFRLRENDYAFGNRKFGGNAQSITRTRWIHHTSFLWDYDAENMMYLKLPTRAPNYRSARSHMEFLCRMKEYMPRSVFFDNTIKAISNFFCVNAVNIDVDAMLCDVEFTHSTTLLTKQDLVDACSSKCSSENILQQSAR